MERSENLKPWILTFSFVISMMVMLLLFMPSAHAQDVYNFYFQKGAGPQMVQQGGGGQATAPLAPVAEAPVAPPAPAVAEAKVEAVVPVSGKAEARDKEYKRWGVYAGGGGTADQAGSSARFMMGGEFNFNRYLGVNTQVLFGSKEQGNSDNYRDKQAPVEMALGLHLTPVRLDFFGWSMFELSALAGVMSAQKRETSYAYSMFGEGSEQTSYARRLVPYLGVGVGLNLHSNFAILAQGRVGDQKEYTQAWAAIAYRF